MNLTPDTEARGTKAYEQARAFERMRTWRLPVAFTIFPLLGLLSGILLWRTDHIILAWINFIMAAFVTWASQFQWKQLVARHARNLRLLAQLKDEYGYKLPWVQMEKHFAALEEIKREIAEKSATDNKR